MRRLSFLATGMAMLAIGHAAEPPTRLELTLVDLQGQKKVLATLPGTVIAPRISPDGTKVAYEQTDPTGTAGPQSLQIQVAALGRMDKPLALQFTLASTRNLNPVWSRDGDWIFFAATGNGSDSLYRQRADAWIQPKYIVDGVAPDGMHEGGLAGQLSYLTRKGDKDYGVALMDLSTRKITRFDLPNTAQYSSALSRDGQWMAFTSDETGRPEVWLESVSQPSKRVQLTRQGGSHPQWSPDGTLLYFSQGGQMFSLNVKFEGQSPAAEAPKALPVSGFVQGELRRQWDLMPDGKAFLMLFPAAR